MSYKIRTTDSSKEFIVEDGDKDQSQLSITLIGKKASGYAEYVSENFLHLLENFAGETQPANPIDGQLWYNTSDQFNKKLQVHNGNTFVPVNGVYQQDNTPATASKGDIWVNTAKAQVFLTLDGSSWSLVGPSFSSVLKSGSYPEEIRDITGELHTVVKNYIDDEVVEIVSNSQFTPQQKISGFTNIKPGINLSTNNNATLNASAFAAENIVITSPNRLIVSGNSFVRNDVNSSINGVLNLRQGLTIGFDPTFVVEKISNDSNVFRNLTPDGSFRFNIRSQGNSNEVLTLYGLTTDADPRPKVGINKIIPDRELDVVGNARIDGTLEVVKDLIVTNKATFSDSVTLNSAATFTNTATFTSTVQLGIVGNPANIPVTDIIVPLTTDRYNIGTSSRRFNEIYSSKFFGELRGNAESASSLTTVASFDISGDIQSSGFSYSGLGGKSTFVTNASPDLIIGKPVLNSVSPGDEILVAVQPADYINIQSITLTGEGIGASFNVRRTASAYEILAIVNTGSGYAISDLLTIPGSILGGSAANDLSIQVQQVAPNGSIIRDVLQSVIATGTPVAGLNKTSKQTFFADINEFLIPPGTIIPFAGLTSPPGWLFCDGSVVDSADYPGLFGAIRYIYGKTNLSNQFLLPDLKGRMIIGYDDMSNGLLSSIGAANRVPSATTPVNNQGNTPPITGGSTTATNDTITNQFGGTESGIRANVMNPFIAMNYIIKV
jgi:hypothetical protein